MPGSCVDGPVTARSARQGEVDAPVGRVTGVGAIQIWLADPGVIEHARIVAPGEFAAGCKFSRERAVSGFRRFEVIRSDYCERRGSRGEAWGFQ
jgi:hypothetical protein